MFDLKTFQMNKLSDVIYDPKMLSVRQLNTAIDSIDNVDSMYTARTRKEVNPYIRFARYTTDTGWTLKAAAKASIKKNYKDFAKKIKFDNIDESKIESLSNPNYTNMLINAIENSDAVIKASEELPIELLDYLSKSEKPVLDYFPVEEFENTYTEFYLTQVL